MEYHTRQSVARLHLSAKRSTDAVDHADKWRTTETNRRRVRWRVRTGRRSGRAISRARLARTRRSVENRHLRSGIMRVAPNVGGLADGTAAMDARRPRDRVYRYSAIESMDAAD